MKVKCTGCGEFTDSEHPEMVKALNTETLRWGWLHRFCMEVAYENASLEQRQKARNKHWLMSI